MIKYLTDLYLDPDVLKLLCILFFIIIVYLSNVANKYWRLKNNMDFDIKQVQEDINIIKENQEDSKDSLDDLNLSVRELNRFLNR